MSADFIPCRCDECGAGVVVRLDIASSTSPLFCSDRCDARFAQRAADAAEAAQQREEMLREVKEDARRDGYEAGRRYAAVACMEAHLPDEYRRQPFRDAFRRGWNAAAYDAAPRD